MFTAGELADFRQVFGDTFLTDTVTVERPTRVRNATTGATTTTYAAHHTERARVVAASLQPDEREVGGRGQTIGGYIVRLEITADVLGTDRLLLSDGRRLQIIAPPAHGTESFLKRVSAVEVT